MYMSKKVRKKKRGRMPNRGHEPMILPNPMCLPTKPRLIIVINYSNLVLNYPFEGVEQQTKQPTPY